MRRSKTTKSEKYPLGYGEVEIATSREASPFTMTDKRRQLSLMYAVQYVATQGVHGDIVECGVWKGGSMMIVARTLLNLGVTDRKLHLFDTYAGMPKPGNQDTSFEEGVDAQQLFNETRFDDRDGSDWCYGSLDEVKRNVESTGYPKALIHYVAGKVETTIPSHAPTAIALLRLDTDWYESTLHEMNYLFPRLTKGGVLLVDDYLYWRGARKAIDEYVERNGVRLFLNPIDGGGVIGIKQDSKCAESPE